jgi:23S rRNA (adenine2503-C2)-methyltransferase
MNKERNIINFDLDSLKNIFSDEKSYCAQQIFEWLHKKNVYNFDQMSNISNTLINKLNKNFKIYYPSVIKTYACNDNTEKILLSLHDKNLIETVIIKNNRGSTVCISSQVGCRMNCKFCASCKNGFKRNLDVYELCTQVYIAKRFAEKISNIVIMGMGEPLDNFDNVLKFIKIINCDHGFNIGQRSITISTCGLLNKIKLLSEKKLQINLAISLHAADNNKRKYLMPIAKLYSLDDLIKTCKLYFNATGRRITFEYTLIKNINDTQKDAFNLIRLLRHLSCHVNLINFNTIRSVDFVKSDTRTQNLFIKILKLHGINVTVRKSYGEYINAACGQLAGVAEN